MGSSSPCFDSKVAPRHQTISFEDNKPYITLPMPLFLLSLIKIKEIKSFLQQHQEIIERKEYEKKFILLNILNDLNKSTKLINDSVKRFKKEFGKEISDKNGIELYDFALKTLDSEINIIDKRNKEDSLIKKLFYFIINKTCAKCQNHFRDYPSLLFSLSLFDDRKFETILYCEKCKQKTKNMIIQNKIPEIIISVNLDLKHNRESDKLLHNGYTFIGGYNTKNLSWKAYDNCYEFDSINNIYRKISVETYLSNYEKNKETIVYIYNFEKQYTSVFNSQNNFFNNKDYKSAIINYCKLKQEKRIEDKMYLINKEYFDYLLIMNNYDISKLNGNDDLYLEQDINKNQLEIMNMNNLIIYDSPDKIRGDIDFINETILKNLGFSNYLGKDVMMKELLKNKIYKIIFKDYSTIKLVFENNKQIISFCGKIPEIPKVDNKLSINNNPINNIVKEIKENNIEENNHKESNQMIMYNNQHSEINNINNINFINNLNNNSQNNDNIKIIKPSTNPEENNNIPNNKDSEIIKNSTVIEENKSAENKFIIDSIYQCLTNLFNDIANIKNLINNHIIDENKYEEFLIINKNCYNRITKILESNEIYDNDNKIFDKISDISDIQNIDENNITLILNNLDIRKNSLNNGELYKIELEKILIDEKDVLYPKDFIIIRENIFKALLVQLGIKPEFIINNKYKLIIGEGNIFINDNLNKNIIFVTENNDKVYYNIELIIKYNGDDKNDLFKKEVNKYIKNKGFNNYLQLRKINMTKRIQDIINLENENIGKIILILRSNPYIRSVFFAFSNIKKISSTFQKLNNHKNVISFLLYNSIKSVNQNLIELDKIIINAEKKMNELSRNSLNMTNFKDLIKFILNALDSELNTKLYDKTIKIEDYDQSFAFNRFKQLMEYQNDSIISKYFFGSKKIISKYQKCNIEKYNYKPLKYLYFKIEKDSPTDINLLIQLYESKQKNDKGNCEYCGKKEEDFIKHKELHSLPEILIIIFDNPTNAKINSSLSVKIKNENFYLISSITKTNDDNNFNILCKEGLKYLIFDGNEKKEFIGNINDLISYPFVLFYEKETKEIKEIKEVTEAEIYLQDSNPPSFVNKQNQMGEIDDINNNNLKNNMINIMANNSVNNNFNPMNQNNIGQNFNNIKNNNPINNVNNINNNMNQNNDMNNQMNDNLQNNMMNNNNINQNNMMNLNNNMNNQINNNLQNNMMNPQNKPNINKSWDPFNRMMNMNKNLNNNNPQNNMNNLNNMNNNFNNNNFQLMNNQQMNNQKNINRSFFPNNNFGLNNQMNQMNLMNPNNNQNNIINNNNMQIANNMMMNQGFVQQNNQPNNNPNMFMNNNNNMNMNNQFNNQINNNRMNQGNQNLQNNFNKFNNAQMMNMNQFPMNNQMNSNQFMNQNNNPMMNQNNNPMMNQNNIQIMNNNQLSNPNNNQMMNQNNIQMMSNNQLSNPNNNQMMNQNNIQMMNPNNNPMMNNNQLNNQNNKPIMNNNPMMNGNQIMNQNNNPIMIINPKMNPDNIPQIQNNSQDMNQINNNMASLNNVNIENSQNNNNMSKINLGNPITENNNDTYLNNANNDLITIYFNFQNEKQIYIDIDKNTKFREVINQLTEKYEWLSSVRIKCFMLKGIEINEDKSCEENGIEDSSKIDIIEI